MDRIHDDVSHMNKQVESNSLWFLMSIMQHGDTVAAETQLRQDDILLVWHLLVPLFRCELLFSENWLRSALLSMCVQHQQSFGGFTLKWPDKYDKHIDECSDWTFFTCLKMEASSVYTN